MPPHPPAHAEHAQVGTDAAAFVVAPPAISVLRQRADFLRASKARRAGTPGFLLQARKRGAQEPAETPLRVGFTCSKKIGNAVMRNRAKRRLRAVAREVLPDLGRAGWDYVLVGRPDATVSRDYQSLVADLRAALSRIHAGGSKA
ncbi:ribonuclease P protein component [Paracoccus isoporae]|uniref:Ribonuclease P protein component n=1 Tax=Paracoccus isoporae TaxID=591205 RepID=A0A1G7GDP4_9RHOB|nr:ribonuclease P protein component [Paracoccus isoporae]SDE86262.1 ribonuclease P protein component [Paracoccus isoporae]